MEEYSDEMEMTGHHEEFDFALSDQYKVSKCCSNLFENIEPSFITLATLTMDFSALYISFSCFNHQLYFCFFNNVKHINLITNYYHA